MTDLFILCCGVFGVFLMIEGLTQLGFYGLVVILLGMAIGFQSLSMLMSQPNKVSSCYGQTLSQAKAAKEKTDRAAS